MTYQSLLGDNMAAFRRVTYLSIQLNLKNIFHACKYAKLRKCTVEYRLKFFFLTNANSQRTGNTIQKWNILKLFALLHTTQTQP